MAAIIDKAKDALTQHNGKTYTLAGSPVGTTGFGMMGLTWRPNPVSQDQAFAAMKAALDNGANFFNGAIFQINEQKYFASTDGSYIDQDVHRIWPTFTATAVDPARGKFQTRQALSAPVGMGWEYLAGRAADKVQGPMGTLYGKSFDMIEDAMSGMASTVAVTSRSA